MLNKPKKNPKFENPSPAHPPILPPVAPPTTTNHCPPSTLPQSTSIHHRPLAHYRRNPKNSNFKTLNCEIPIFVNLLHEFTIHPSQSIKIDLTLRFLSKFYPKCLNHEWNSIYMWLNWLQNPRFEPLNCPAIRGPPCWKLTPEANAKSLSLGDFVVAAIRHRRLPYWCCCCSATECLACYWEFLFLMSNQKNVLKRHQGNVAHVQKRHS